MIFVPDEEEGFIPAVVQTEFTKGQETKVKLHWNNKIKKISKAKSALVEKMDYQSLTAVPDLIKLKLLNNASLLYNLRLRYCNENKAEIYTNIGAILVAINPYQDLQLYLREQEEIYLNAGAALADTPPHIFKVAEAAFNNMKSEGKDQSCVITGESGAGKTETTKRFLQYISEKSKRNRESLEEDFGIDTERLRKQILDSNPFMEAFGNAKTSRNDNSSRFGKLIEMYFQTTKGVVIGAQITSYLLEKSRVVKVSAGERSYHIFYQLCAAATESTPELADKFYLQAANNFNYTLGENKTLKDLTIEGEEDAVVFEETKQAMKKLGLSEEEIEATFRICCAILHTGNIEFQGEDKDLAELKPGVKDTALRFASELFGVDELSLEEAILERSLLGKDVKRHTVKEAEAARDALSKFVYEKLFVWLIGKMNRAMANKGSKKKGKKMGGRPTVLGVLDIFGFETFEYNSFEQMCINFCNEKLQGFFNLHVFMREQEEYKAEGIDFKNVGFSDNQGVIDAFENGPKAVMIICDDLCNLEAATDKTLLDRIYSNAQERTPKTEPTHFLFKPKVQDRRAFKHYDTAFVVKHYAGFVHYNIEEFLEKNKDQLRRDIRVCLASSSCDLVSKFFPKGGDLGNGKQKKFKNTLSTKFRNSLKSLMDRLDKTTPQFVRCIKPNDKNCPGEFDPKKIMKQLNEAGLLEVCRIRKLGYPIKIPHKKFLNDYLCLDRSARNNIEDLERKLMEKGFLYGTNNTNNWQIGKTKVFLRSDQFYDLERHRGEALKETLRIIQGFAKTYLFRVTVKKAMKALKMIQKGISTRNGEMLNSGLNFFLEKGPLFAKLPIVIDGVRVMKDLQTQLDIIDELKEAMEKKDFSTIRVKIDIAKSMGIEHPELKKAEGMLADYQERREVKKKLNRAVKSRDVKQIKEAIALAKKRNQTDLDVYGKAVALLESLMEREVAMDALKKALSDPNLDKAEIERLIKELRGLGLSPEDPLIVEAARKCQLVIERAKKQEKRIKDLVKQLKRNIKKRNVGKLKDLIKVALDLHYSGPLLEEAQELVEELEQREELLNEVSNASRVLKEKCKLPDGITDTDLKPLQHAIKVACKSDALGLDSELQVMAAEELLEQAGLQLVVQDEVSGVLKVENKKAFYKMLDKVQRLGLQTREADELVQKVREIELFKQRAEALTNEGRFETDLLALVVPEEKARLKHLLERAGTLNDEGFKKLLNEVESSNTFSFNKYYRMRSDADYVSNERKGRRKKRKVMRFAYEEDTPITKSLLEMDERQEEKAVLINETIHKFCDSLSDNKKISLENAMSLVVTYGICDTTLADEIYLQLAKHLRGNDNNISKKNSWHLLCLCATYFPTSRSFLPFMLAYLKKVSKEMGIEANFAKYVMSQLSASLHHDPRIINYKPGSAEIRAFFRNPPALIELENLNGSFSLVPVPPDFKLYQAAPIIRKITGIKIDLKNPEWSVFIRNINRPIKQTYKQRLEAFYNHYKPENLGNIDQILAYHKGREEQLFTRLTTMGQYGPEPEVELDFALDTNVGSKKKKKKINYDGGDNQSQGSSMSKSSIGSAVSKLSSSVSRVFRRMRGHSIVDPKQLEKPTPRGAWPLPWYIRIGRVLNNVYNQNKVPLLYYRRRYIPQNVKSNEDLFLQLKADYLIGNLIPKDNTAYGNVSALLVTERRLRLNLAIPFGDARKFKKAGVFRMVPRPIWQQNSHKNEWVSALTEVAADFSNSLEGKSQEEVQKIFVEVCRNIETFGMCFFYAQVLRGDVKGYIAKGQTPDGEGIIKIGVSPTQVMFIDPESFDVKSYFNIADFVSVEESSQFITLNIKKELKYKKKSQAEENKKKNVRGKSLRYKAGSTFNQLKKKLLGPKTHKIQLSTIQHKELKDIIYFCKEKLKSS